MRAGHLQGHHYRHQLVVLGNDAAALEAEAVGAQEEALRREVAHDVRRGGIQAARVDVLEGDTTFAALSGRRPWR